MLMLLVFFQKGHLAFNNNKKMSLSNQNLDILRSLSNFSINLSEMVFYSLPI